MEKEKSTNLSANKKIETAKADTQTTTATPEPAVATTTFSDGLDTASQAKVMSEVQSPMLIENTDQKLKALEDRLDQKINNKSGSKTGALWLAVILSLATAAAAGYSAFTTQQQLNLLHQTAAANQQTLSKSLQDIDKGLFKIDHFTPLLEKANASAEQLQKDFAILGQNDQNLNKALTQVSTQAQSNAKALGSVTSEVNRLRERNADDWLLSESFFLTNNAFQKAVYEKDIDAAVWMLTKADELLVGIEKEDVIALRETISKDISLLKNIASVDVRGLGITLDRAYDNVDKLVLNGYSDPALRAQNFDKPHETTADIKDWKENLLASAEDFSSRFIEVRRRDANAVTEFLTPAQEVFVRENIKTRLLLAKADLSHGEKDAMVANLNQAINLIKAYFEEKSEVTISTLNMLDSLRKSNITIQTPKLLQSSVSFSEFAKEHLLGRGK